MLTLTQNILILIVTITGSMLFMAALNRIWPREKRQVHNDLIGWQLNIIGTTYAVILGFMLYTVWTDFGAANLNVDLEASALRNVYRLAEGLPEQQRTQLQLQARSYADAVINQDWPEMANDQIPEESHLINQAMWKTLMSVKLATPSEIVAEDHAISELSTLTEHRRTRLLQSKYRLPIIFWARPSHRRTSHHHLRLHVRLGKSHASRPPGIFLHSSHHPGAARHRRCQSTVSRLGPRQQLRLPQSTKNMKN